MRSFFALLAVTLATLPSLHAAPANTTAPHEPPGNAIELNRLNAKKEEPWRHHIFQGRIDLDPSASYVIEFSACASKKLHLDLFTKNDEPPWAFFGLQKHVSLGTTWARHRFVFPANKAIPKYSRLTFGFVTSDAAAIWIADISLHKIENSQPVGPNLIRNPRFEQNLAAWSVEGRDTGTDEFTVDVVPVSVLGRAASAP